jgi:hypothetical protein
MKAKRRKQIKFMLESFVPTNFTGESLAMIERINTILATYEAEGYDLSLRQLYYQLVSRNFVENTERSYKNVGSLVSDARLAGLIDWDMIKDRGRAMISNPHWTTPKDFIDSVTPQYKIDHWRNQDNYVEVMVEKQALEGVLEPVCSELDVPFTANKGYSSSSAMYEASKRFINRAQVGKELYVLYLGDHDPSGIDMTRDVSDRLDIFIQGQHESIVVNRLALNMDQVRELKPPENPAKITDSRAKDYIRKFGRNSWELDAIEPRRLATLVRDAVTALMDVRKFKASKKLEADGRALLIAAAKKFKS